MLLGGRYPFNLTFPVRNDDPFANQNTTIRGSLDIIPVASASHSELTACAASSLSDGKCTGPGTSVPHNSAIHFELDAKDVDGHAIRPTELPESIRKEIYAPRIWRCPPKTKERGSVSGVFSQIKEAGSSLISGSEDAIPVTDPPSTVSSKCPTKQDSCEQLITELDSDTDLYVYRPLPFVKPPELKPGQHRLYIETDTNDTRDSLSVECLRWSKPLVVECAEGYDPAEGGCKESRTAQKVAQGVSAGVVVVAVVPMVFLIKKDPAKFKAIIAGFVTGPLMVAVGMVFEFLDIIGDHAFYQGVYGGWMWDTDAVPEGVQTAEANDARKLLKAPWNAALVVATIISIAAIFLSAFVYIREFKQRQQDVELALTDNDMLQVAAVLDKIKLIKAPDEIIQPLKDAVQRDQSSQMTQDEWELLDTMRKDFNNGPNERQMLYGKIVLGFLEDVPLASLSIAWSIRSKQAFTDVQTLSLCLSMLMLGMKLAKIISLPKLWKEQTALLLKLREFKIGEGREMTAASVAGVYSFLPAYLRYVSISVHMPCLISHPCHHIFA